MRMQYFLSLLGLVALATVALVGFRAHVANAAGATVIDDFGCLILDSDSGLPDILLSQDSHTVQTPSGNVNFLCDFTFDPNLCPNGAGSPALRHQGFGCGTPFGVTTNTKAVTDCTAGTVHLSCQIKGHQP